MPWFRDRPEDRIASGRLLTHDPYVLPRDRWGPEIMQRLVFAHGEGAGRPAGGVPEDIQPWEVRQATMNQPDVYGLPRWTAIWSQLQLQEAYFKLVERRLRASWPWLGWGRL
jgi:hypothetical protein